MKTQLDLNCDLGEGETPRQTAALMRWITSANIACGGHAGSIQSMETCLKMARRWNVLPGAHPGSPQGGAFGRDPVQIGPADLQLLLLHQVSAFDAVARAAGLRMHHIKLHGALYHAAESDLELARSAAEAVRRWWPKSKLYARAGGLLQSTARRMKVTVWEEIFADRNYLPDGTLVPRSNPRALITNPSAVVERVRQYLAEHQIETWDGQALDLAAQTVCIHSDTPGAADIARRVAATLGIKA